MLMRIPVLGLACTALLASSAVAQPLNPPSEDATGVVLRSTVGEFSGPRSGRRRAGCRCAAGRDRDHHGRMRPRALCRQSARGADARPTARTGYRAVLATDQRIRDGNLQVRVPDMPEAGQPGVPGEGVPSGRAGAADLRSRRHPDRRPARQGRVAALRSRASPPHAGR